MTHEAVICHTADHSVQSNKLNCPTWPQMTPVIIVNMICLGANHLNMSAIFPHFDLAGLHTFPLILDREIALLCLIITTPPTSLFPPCRLRSSNHNTIKKTYLYVPRALQKGGGGESKLYVASKSLFTFWVAIVRRCFPVKGLWQALTSVVQLL